MPEPSTLYVLAGYPASGKSTLLRAFVQRGAPLFGEAHDQALRGSIRATRFDEEIPTALKLDRGMWMHLRDLDALEASAQLPDRLIIHLDLLFLLIGRLRPETLADLAPDRQSRVFGDWLDRPLFQRFDRLVINTVVPPIEAIQAFWRKKRAGRDFGGDRILAVQRDLIFNVPDPGAVYATVLASWAERARAVTPHVFRTSPMPASGTPL